MSFNKIFIMGQVGQEPQLKESSNGLAVCYLSVATNEFIKEEKVATWYQVILFGAKAELAKKQLTKGSKVYVEGQLRPQQIDDKKGKSHTVLEIKCSDFHALDLSS